MFKITIDELYQVDEMRFGFLAPLDEFLAPKEAYSKLGFADPSLLAPKEEKIQLKEKIQMAKEENFDGIELIIVPGGEIDPETITDDKIGEFRNYLQDTGVKVLSAMYLSNFAKRFGSNIEKICNSLGRAMDIARKFGTNILTTNAWVPKGSDRDKLEYYAQVWPEVAELAEEKNVKVAIENCPHNGENIAYSPLMWQKMFDEVPSKAIGLEFDPSHLVWLGVDYIGALKMFSDRVYIFHVKDTEVLSNDLKRKGIMGENWWRFRIPGWGDVDWKAIFSVLAEINYKGDIIIEHEDPFFRGPYVREGLARSLKFIREMAIYSNY